VEFHNRSNSVRFIDSCKCSVNIVQAVDSGHLPCVTAMRDRRNQGRQAPVYRQIADLVDALPIPVALISARRSVAFANRAFSLLTDKPTGAPASDTKIPSHLLDALQSNAGVPAVWIAPGGKVCRLVGVPVGEALGVAALEGPEQPDAEAIARALARLRELERRLIHDAAAVAALREIASELDPQGSEQDTSPAALGELFAGVIERRAGELDGHGIAVQVQGGFSPELVVQTEPIRSLLIELVSQVVSELVLWPEPRALRCVLTGGITEPAQIRFTHNGNLRPNVALKAKAEAAGAELRVIAAGPGLGVTYIVELA
jgi:PAS domain-containing protein